MRRIRKKKRDFTWLSETINSTATDSTLDQSDLPIHGNAGFLAGIQGPLGGVAHDVQGALFHRVLLDVEIGYAVGGGGGAAKLGIGNFLDIGLLLTETDTTNVAIPYDPGLVENQGDVAWLWRYHFPLTNLDLSAVVTPTVISNGNYDIVHPQTPLHFDIAIRGGRGSRCTDKRRVYMWVASVTVNVPFAVNVEYTLNCAYLYSVGVR